MEENNERKRTPPGMLARKLFGRRMILTDKEFIDATNIREVLQDSLPDHLANRNEIEYLYRYYKGRHPIIDRRKEVRPEINNTIVENRANLVVTFRVGYTVGKPIQYVSSVADEDVSKSIAMLNDLMRMAGKPSVDKQLVEWQMICGTGFRIVLPNEERNSKIPFVVYALDPRSTFVVYRNDYAHKPLAGVTYVTDREGNTVYTVYTDKACYTVKGGVVEEKPYVVGRIPIIEYPLNHARLGAFEVALPLMDALDLLDSNRIDSVEQFVQSLLVCYNCQFDDDMTANAIREAGMVVLKSIGENKADIKVISETLNQTEVQTLKADLITAINEITGTPRQDSEQRSDSSNNGAVVLRNGWQGAETRAEDFEMMFHSPEMRTLELVSIILKGVSDASFDPYKVDVKFTRRNFEDILSKSQTLTTMLDNDKIHPQCAYEASGMFVDVQEAYNMGMEWYKAKQEEAKQQMESLPQGEEGNTDVVKAQSAKGGEYVSGYWR